MKSLAPEDRKLVVITVVATVAANLITVVVVALAITLARDLKPQPDTPKSYLLLIPVTASPATVALIAFSVQSTLKENSSVVAKIFRWAMIVLGVVATFCLLLLVLSWVGFASGIK